MGEETKGNQGEGHKTQQTERQREKEGRKDQDR